MWPLRIFPSMADALEPPSSAPSRYFFVSRLLPLRADALNCLLYQSIKQLSHVFASSSKIYTEKTLSEKTKKMMFVLVAEEGERVSTTPFLLKVML